MKQSRAEWAKRGTNEWHLVGARGVAAMMAPKGVPDLEWEKEHQYLFFHADHGVEVTHAKGKREREVPSLGVRMHEKLPGSGC